MVKPALVAARIGTSPTAHARRQQTMLEASGSDARWLDLARWFEAQFGSTQCRALTGCDFATTEGVHASIERDGTARCAEIAQRVGAIIATESSDFGV